MTDYDKIADGTIPSPTLKDVALGTIGQFPEGIDISFRVFIREAYMKYRDKGTTRIDIPRYGTLTMQGRKYRFEFTDSYAAKKGYEKVIEGSWG